ncbi:LacI family DNA-binding transcriptional regulator [Deinococcus sp.]|uniref:LacI family DNA-binding transcriptional regulator n=1 Tax=Deinococcus sp. TaxID=47478 RepID=UPI003C7A8C80
MACSTINDIARATGVSKGTVSRMLNDRRTVASRTRVAVQQVTADLNYAPDPAAWHLSWRTGQTLGLSTLSPAPLAQPVSGAVPASAGGPHRACQSANTRPAR